MAEFLRDPQNSEISGTNGIGEAEEPIQGHAIVDPPNNHLYSEVLREFTDWYFSVSPEDFDEELLDAYLEEMDNLSPMEGSFDSQASLEKFHERFPSLFDIQKELYNPDVPQSPESKRHRHFRRLIVIAATIAAMIATMISAQAFGIDVFGFFAKWTDDIFFFEDGPEMLETSEGHPFPEGEVIQFETIEDALAAFRIEEPLAPKSYPNGITTLNVTGCVTPHGIDIYAFSDDDEIAFKISFSEFLAQDGPISVIEKDEEKTWSYTKGTHVHYIVVDDGLCTATWLVNNIQCIISGFITQDEMIKIIDSIYEVV